MLLGMTLIPVGTSLIAPRSSLSDSLGSALPLAFMLVGDSVVFGPV